MAPKKQEQNFFFRLASRADDNEIKTGKNDPIGCDCSLLFSSYYLELGHLLRFDISNKKKK
jgi:hypothetical protein